jgi:hypothetical protein
MHIYATFSDDPPQAGEKTKSETVSKIVALYDEGVPFFTKEAIRHVYQQLKAAGPECRKVSVTGVDGRVVEFSMDVGLCWKADEPDVEEVL